MVTAGSVVQENNNMSIKYEGSRLILLKYLKEINAIFFIRDNCIEVVNPEGSIFITKRK